MNALNMKATSSTARRAACTALLILPLIMNAQLDRSKPPVPAQPPAVHVGEHKTFTLPNGLRVIVVENRKLSLVSVQVRFDMFPIVQKKHANAIELMDELLAAGTAKHSKADIDERIDRMGAQLATGPEGVYASVLSKHLSAMLPLFADVVRNPAFPEQEFQSARQRMTSEVKQRKDDPSAIAEAVGRAAIFSKSHPYGEIATTKSLGTLQREQAAACHAKFFRPEIGYLVFVGDINEKEAKALAKSHFGDWKPSQRYVVVHEDGTQTLDGFGEVRFLDKPRVPSGPRRVVMVDRPGAAQSIIRIGFPLNLHPKDNRALAAQVMNTILGGGVFNARLMQNLREDKGWTYGCYANLESDRFNGYFTASASVRTAVTDSAVAEMMKELERMRTTKVTTEELDLAKQFMAGSFGRNLEDPRTIARFALNTYLNELPKDHYSTYLKRLDAITSDDVQAAAEAFLHPDNAVILVVGDKNKLQARLAPLSWNQGQPVMELDADGDRYVETFEPVRDRTAEQVIERHLEAIGGRAAIARIKDMRMGLSTEMAGTPVEVMQWYGPDGLFRSQAKANGAVIQEEIFDGQRGLRRNAMGTVELEDHDLAEVRFNGHPVPELHYAKEVERATLSGRTSIDGKPVLKVHMVLFAGGTVGDYFDEQSGLKLRRVELRSRRAAHGDHHGL
ncbi:MAG: insulinase family protein [Flavobacteriales bacterium]|nr:insulinase family protein [Flavobacteriales bacterium]